MIQSREEPVHRVIALSGWKGSGKDTVADYLVNEYGYTKLSFAAKLKDSVAAQYVIERSDLDHPIRKEDRITKYPAHATDAFSAQIQEMLSSELNKGYWTPRALCILEGSIKRAVDPNYWVRSIAEHILLNPHSLYVISDMRYQSEAEILNMLIPEIHMVRIERFSDVGTKDPSERDLDTYGAFGHTILNTSDVAYLYSQVDRIVMEK